MPDRKHLFRRGRTISPAATPKRPPSPAAAPVEPIIEFRRVSLVHRSGALGLERATFAIARSELAFLTGPAGAGKSTVMRLLTKELEASGGSVWVAGRDLSRIARSGLARYRRNLGLVRHDSVLMADRSVQEQIVDALRELIRRNVVLVDEDPVVREQTKDDLVVDRGRREARGRFRRNAHEIAHLHDRRDDHEDDEEHQHDVDERRDVDVRLDCAAATYLHS